MMIEALDPASSRAAGPEIAGLELSDEAMERFDARANVRTTVDRLLADGFAQDAVAVVARVLPSQYLVAWGCECIRQGTRPGSPLTDPDQAGLALAEQCIRHPTEENWRMCMDFAERSDYAIAGAWIAAAAAWVEGSLAPAGVAAVRAPASAVSEAVLAALTMIAAGGGRAGTEVFANWADRALAVFGTR